MHADSTTFGMLHMLKAFAQCDIYRLEDEKSNLGLTLIDTNNVVCLQRFGSKHVTESEKCIIVQVIFGQLNAIGPNMLYYIKT